MCHSTLQRPKLSDPPMQHDEGRARTLNYVIAVKAGEIRPCYLSAQVKVECNQSRRHLRPAAERCVPHKLPATKTTIRMKCTEM